MKRVFAAVSGLCISGASAFGGTVLNVSVETPGGSNDVTVQAGAVVSYQIVGELGAGVADNNGLALVGFDLELVGTPDPGPLDAADAPTSGSMTAFVKPDGITNPDGYGGTLIGNVRTQIGGGQNTINNVYFCSSDSDCPGGTNTCGLVDLLCSQSASFPRGAVQTGIAWPGSPQVLVSGMFTVPAGATDGTIYQLVLSNLFANVILAGEDGTGPHGFHKVTGVVAGGANTPLTVAVGAAGSCVMSGPLNCEIDAAKPHDLLNAAQCNGAAHVCGWQTMELTFVCSGAATPPTQLADYSITSGTAVIGAVDVVGNSGTVTFQNPMATGEWTCVGLTGDPAQEVCQGFLPGDVGGDAKATPADILALIGSLDGSAVRPDFATDVNRSGAADAVDILEVVNVLNGASTYSPGYLNMEISPLACPSAP